MTCFRTITMTMLAILVAAAPGMAAPQRALTTAELVDFCRSQTMAEAEHKGTALGWRRMSDAEDGGWREGFLASNGGTVDVVTWQQSEGGTEALSFWIADGESRHRACSYSTGRPDGLLDGLKQAFGTPSSVLNHDFGEVVVWTRGAMEVSFSRVSSSAGVTISYDF